MSHAAPLHPRMSPPDDGQSPHLPNPPLIHLCVVSVRPQMANLVYNNSRTLNFQRFLYLVSQHLPRAAEHRTRVGRSDAGPIAAANAVHLARLVIKDLMEQLNSTQLLSFVELPGEGRGGASPPPPPCPAWCCWPARRQRRRQRTGGRRRARISERAAAWRQRCQTCTAGRWWSRWRGRRCRRCLRSGERRRAWLRGPTSCSWRRCSCCWCCAAASSTRPAPGRSWGSTPSWKC